VDPALPSHACPAEGTIVVFPHFVVLPPLRPPPPFFGMSTSVGNHKGHFEISRSQPRKTSVERSKLSKFG